jgi:hypothetical protein
MLRTCNLRHAMAALYQLSYEPERFRTVALNTPKWILPCHSRGRNYPTGSNMTLQLKGVRGELGFTGNPFNRDATFSRRLRIAELK